MRSISALLAGLVTAATGCSLVLSDGDADVDAEIETVVLHRDNTTIVDTWVWEAMPDLDNSADDMLVWDRDLGDPPSQEGPAATLLRFELSRALIPESAKIVEARLLMTVLDNGDPGQLGVMRAPWDPTDTWSTIGTEPGLIPGVDFSAVAVMVLAPGEGLRISTDVTDSVNTWHTGDLPNNGWVVVDSGSNGVEMHSSENEFPERAPTLEIDIVRAE